MGLEQVEAHRRHGERLGATHDAAKAREALLAWLGLELGLGLTLGVGPERLERLCLTRGEDDEAEAAGADESEDQGAAHPACLESETGGEVDS